MLKVAYPHNYPVTICNGIIWEKVLLYNHCAIIKQNILVQFFFYKVIQEQLYMLINKLMI